MSPLIISLSFAQGFDATGPNLPPDGASVRDPLTTFGARPLGTGAITVMGEGGSGLLVREVRDGPFVRVEPVLDSVFGANIGGTLGLGDRFGVALALPVWAGANSESSTAPALGDMHLWFPVSLVHRPGAFGLSVVPFARLPTGARDRFLGDPIGGGMLVSTAVHRGVFTATADLGLSASAATGSEDWPGGLVGQFAVTGGLIPSDRWGAHVEIRGRSPFRSGLLTVPTEALVSVKGRATDRVMLSLGAGSAITRGVGAASPRLFFGTTVSLGPVGDESAESLELLAGPVKEILVLNSQRFPIEGATVTAGRTVAVTDADGFADLPIKAVDKADSVLVEHPKYKVLDAKNSEQDAEWWEVVLERRPVRVEISVVGPDGEPMTEADVRMVSADDPAVETPEMALDELGVRRWELPPDSKWVVSMIADQMGGQARVIQIPPERVESIRMDVVLAYAVDPTTNLAVTVVDGTGETVEDATVAVENRDFGTTGPGGVIEINGLPRGEHVLTIRSSQYGEAKVTGVDVQDATQVTAVLEWPAGSVLTSVRGIDGKPLDATVVFQGPVDLPPRQLGSDGEQLFVLRPGEWTARVQFGDLAPQQRTLVVSDEVGVVQKLDIALLPELPGAAELTVRVAGEDGAPMSGVELALDGLLVGASGPDGSLVLLQLAPGERKISAHGELLYPEELTVDLVEDGRQVIYVAMRRVAGLVELRTEEDGEAVAMEISIEGDRDLPPVETGPDGQGVVVLPEGTWVLKGQTEDGKLVERTVVIAEDQRSPQAVMLQALDGDAGITIEVEDSKGHSVEGAEVAIDGISIGQTQQGKVQIQGVDTGSVEVSVEGVGFEDAVVSAVVEDGDVVRVELDEPVRAVQIEVQGPEGPVAAEITLHSADTPTRAAHVDPERPTELNLDEGVYYGVVQAEGMAPQEVVVEVDRGPRPVKLDVEMTPTAKDDPKVFAVEDPSGAPVAGARIMAGDQELGVTSEGGTVTLSNVPAGVVLRVEPDSSTLGSFDIGADPKSGSTFVAQDTRVSVPVSVSARDGESTSGFTVEVVGLDIEASVNEQGEAAVELPPGTWTLIIKNGDRVAATEVVVFASASASAAPPPAAELEVVSVQTRVVGSMVQLAHPILFDLDQAVIRPDEEGILDDVALLIRADRSLALVEIAGHTDDQGGVVYNQELSERRANAVKEALIERGVAPERLVRRGYGLSRPASPRQDEAARHLNRRVEVVVLEVVE